MYKENKFELGDSICSLKVNEMFEKRRRYF